MLIGNCTISGVKMGAVKRYGDVLIVDDEKNLCETVETYLNEMACFRNILVANDGSQAMRKITNQKFSIILLDLSMPKKEGIDIIRSIADKKDKQKFNSVEKIVIMSGTMNEFQLQEAMHLGVRNFLIKPFDKDKFITKIEQIVKAISVEDL